MMPVPGTVIPDPKGVLIVSVMATALPAASATERWVVPESSGAKPGPGTAMETSRRCQVHGARRHQAGLMRARWAAA